MDILSHALYGYAITLRKSKFALAAFFGALPDLFAFTIPFIIGVFSGGFVRDGRPIFGDYVSFLYSISHSLVIAAVVFVIIYAFKKKVYIWMLGWPLHILLDIPTHSKEFFATPFLFPISDFRFDGIPWSTSYIFFPNWILIAIIYIYLFRKEIKMFFKNLTKKTISN